MGFLIPPGGRFKRFGDTLIDHDTQSNIVPSTHPITINSLGSTQSRIARSRSVTAATDISRTAPTFNDPRYTFTTLSIPTDLRTLNGLYRFFDDTDPVVGNSLRLHCLPAGEVVLTNNGVKNIENIDVNDKIISREGQYQNILKTFSSQYNGDIYTIKAAGTLSLTCTDEHRILVCGQTTVKTRKDSSRKEPTKQLEWKSAKDLKAGDYVVYPKYFPNTSFWKSTIDFADFVNEFRPGPKGGKLYEITTETIRTLMGESRIYPRYIEVNEEFAELAGWYVAEGWVSQTKISSCLCFALGNHEQQNIERIQYLVKSIFGVSSSIYKNKKSNGITINVCCSAAARLFKTLFGNGAHNKNIPDYIMLAPENIIKKFIRAYISGDGHIDKYDYQAITVSQTLIHQLKLLASRINLFLNIRVVKDRYNTPEYIFRITKRSASVALDNQLLEQKKHPLYTYFDGKFFYIPVRKITTKKFTGTVYDITTEDSTFLQNFLIHNSEFPLSRVSMKDTGDPVINAQYHDMWSRLQMEKLLFDIALEYWRIGNVFCYGAWNMDDLMWQQFVILNPDYVTVEGTYLNQKPFIKLQPDEHLKRVVTTGQPKFLYDQLPKEIIRYIRMGQEIPLSPNNTFHIAHNKAPYETLGRSIIKRILKSLIYEDRMSMANFAIATRQTIPLTVVKLGDPNSGWVPESDEMEEFRELLSAREVDPNFTVIYHWGIDVQFYGASGRIWNLTNEFNRIMKWKLLGLGISENILTGGGSYASAYAQLEVLRQRYLHFQSTLQNFVYSGIFEPVASACGFYKVDSVTAGKYYTGKRFGSSKDELTKVSEILEKHSKNFDNDIDKEYIKILRQKQAAEASKVEFVYPKLDWDLLSLSNDIQYKQFLMNFDRLFPGQRKVSDQTFYMAARLDPDAEKAKIAKEFKESLETKLEKAKTIQEYKQKFIDAGLPVPLDLDPVKPVPGAPGSPGPGGSIIPPGGTPPLGGTGGGNIPGAPAIIPNAPVGKGQFEGTLPRQPRSPEAARLKSQKMHEHLTEAAIEINQENDEEVLRLRKFNKAAGVPVDQIDIEAKTNAESEKKNSTESRSE